jgi:hypothetical protein
MALTNVHLPKHVGYMITQWWTDDDDSEKGR